MKDYKKIETRLRSRLAEILRRSEALEDDLRHPLEADFEEQAVDLADDEALAGVDEVLRDEAHEIRLALLRLDRGDYGTCASCGSPIGRARLEALPTATLCIECASSDE